MDIKISPSILAADFTKLGKEVELLCNSEADYIHIDVMDGNFVPNLTIGPAVIKALKSLSTIPFDVHLMIQEPEKSIDSYIESGADIITFHLEASKDPENLIKYIKSHHIKAGLSLMPKTPIEKIFPYLDILDLVLIMTVEPGFGGQQFMNDQIDKISQIKNFADKNNKSLLISVDGGINNDTSKIVLKEGANMLVSGSWLFKQADKTKAILDLKNFI